MIEGAIVHPSENYLLFKLAEERGVTVAFLLNGKPLPLQQAELTLYATYQLIKQRLQQQEKSNANR